MTSLRKFFFRKEPVEGLAIFRMALGFLLVVNALFFAPFLSDFFGERGVVEYQAPLLFEKVNLYFFVKPTLFHSAWIWGLHLLSVISLCVGFFTRTSAWIGFITLSSLHEYNPLILNSGDAVLRLMLFYLGLSPAGKAYSVDRILALRKGRVSWTPRMEMPWAQRLIQLQVAFLYFSTSYYKFDGRFWANGEATYYTSRLWDFERFPVPYLFDHLWSIRLITWSSLAIEFALGTLIWYKPFRIPLICIGILLHLGIEYSMNIPLFEWIMIALLIGMLEPRQGHALSGWIEKRLAIFREKLQK